MGTIRKRGKGYQIDYVDPTGKRVRKTFEKRREAEAELGKRVSLMAEGRYLDVKKEYTTTLGELLLKYEDNCKYQRAFYRNKHRWLQNFREFFGEEARLDKIRYMHLESYRTHLWQKLTKRGTVRKDSVSTGSSAVYGMRSKKQWPGR